MRSGDMTLASSAADADVRVWDVGSGREVHAIDNDLSSLAIALNPRDGTLASGGTDRRVTLRTSTAWDTAGVFALEPTKIVASLAWAPGGGVIAVGDVDDATLGKGGLQVVDAATRTVVARLDTGGNPTFAVAFPDDRIVVAMIDRDLRAWDLPAPGSR
jgi:WD40 repeat protein